MTAILGSRLAQISSIRISAVGSSPTHFGPNGCKGCPVPESDAQEARDLPSMGLFIGLWKQATSACSR